MSQSKGPLTGLKVIEFIGIGPGPHVAMMLADMGAEVVRIERQGGQITNPVVERARHRVAVDLKSEDGQAFVRTALKHADEILVLENGQIVERGVHDFLMKNNGPYQRIYDIQYKDQKKILQSQQG